MALSALIAWLNQDVLLVAALAARPLGPSGFPLPNALALGLVTGAVSQGLQAALIRWRSVRQPALVAAVSVAAGMAAGGVVWQTLMNGLIPTSPWGLSIAAVLAAGGILMSLGTALLVAWGVERGRVLATTAAVVLLAAVETVANLTLPVPNPLVILGLVDLPYDLLILLAALFLIHPARRQPEAG